MTRWSACRRRAACATAFARRRSRTSRPSRRPTASRSSRSPTASARRDPSSRWRPRSSPPARTGWPSASSTTRASTCTARRPSTSRRRPSTPAKGPYARARRRPAHPGPLPLQAGGDRAGSVLGGLRGERPVRQARQVGGAGRQHRERQAGREHRLGQGGQALPGPDPRCRRTGAEDQDRHGGLREGRPRVHRHPPAAAARHALRVAATSSSARSRSRCCSRRRSCASRACAGR